MNRWQEDPSSAGTGARAGVALVGASAAVLQAVAPVVAGVGLELRADGAEGSADVVLFGDEAQGQPPEDAVLVGVDAEELWRTAARFPRHRSVMLPQGRAWLAEHLALHCVGGRGHSGRLITVTGVGEAACPDRVGVFVVRAARRAGLEAALVDVHGRGELAALRAAAPDAARDEGGPAGWDEALAWLSDGAAAGLLSALPRLEGTPLLGGASDSEQKVPGEADDAVASVLAGLTGGTDVVVAVLGAARPEAWWESAQGLHQVSDELLALGRGPFPAAAGTGPGREPAGLVTVRSGAPAPDGPDAAAATGTVWAGTVDVRRPRGSAATRRLLRRCWAPRLAAGVRLGSS